VEVRTVRLVRAPSGRLAALLERRRRAHLADAVRRHADAERDARLAIGAPPSAVATRTELYHDLAARLEDTRLPVDSAAYAEIREVLGERPPLLDYGPFSSARDARIEAILGELDEQGA
jgi:hypothetical protein